MTGIVQSALPIVGAAAGYALAPATGGASLALTYASLGATLGGGISSVFSGISASKAAAQQRQQQATATATAVQNRSAVTAQNNAATTDAQSAALLATTAAGRRSRGGLQYTGQNNGLKTTLGG